MAIDGVDNGNRERHLQGMDAISRLQPSHFNEYLKRTQNTICGRNPILVLLQVYGSGGGKRGSRTGFIFERPSTVAGRGAGSRTGFISIKLNYGDEHWFSLI